MKRFVLCIIILLFEAISGFAKDVHRITISGVINPVSADYIMDAIEKAEEADAELLIIQMDTPGGLMSSMHDIVKKILSSEVPVAVYIAPSGSRAGSAGVFITMAAHVAAMAPGTNIGSAHPVTLAGQQDTSQVMLEKIINDAVASIRSVAEKRGRNADWAEKAVRESANITASEALEKNVIDYIAPSTDSLLAMIDGLKIEVLSGKKTLATRNATVIDFEMNWRQKVLDILSDPNIAYILFLLGLSGLGLELYNPGAILPGVVGGICLILFLFAMQTIPINFAGVLLIIFAAVLFLLEIKVTSYGLLSIGGVIALVLGSIMLVDSPLPFLQISWKVIATATICFTLFFLLAIGLAIRAHRRQPATGKEGLVGEEGIVVEDLNPTGMVEVHGEIWKAEATELIRKNKRIIVEAVDTKHLQLKVKQIN
jgi:membrane-bound serine protease (ClpP class)